MATLLGTGPPLVSGRQGGARQGLWSTLSAGGDPCTHSGCVVGWSSARAWEQHSQGLRAFRVGLYPHGSGRWMELSVPGVKNVVSGAVGLGLHLGSPVSSPVTLGHLTLHASVSPSVQCGGELQAGLRDR